MVGQTPGPGTFLATHHSVTLRLSAGPPPVALPGVVDKTEAEARAALEGAGFVVTTEHRTDENVPAGHVVEQQPPAGKATAGSEISLVISDGPKPVEVPDVVGKTYDDAAKALTAKRFKVSAGPTSTATPCRPASSSATIRWPGTAAPATRR